MAALSVAPDFDLAAWHEHLVRNLADYARPLFVRLRPELEVTSTFKHGKVRLAADGYDPAIVTDPLWFNDRSSGRFVPLDADLFRHISRADLRL
jgi:fatty-acyl-CoA synthase